MENVRDFDIDRMMKSFQTEMKKRYRIPPSLVEKYKQDICFMVETDHTCMEALVPRMKFVEPMGYEMSVELIEGSVQIILQFEVDTSCPRWGTYEEKIREVQSKQAVQNFEKKVKKVIDSILKESRMLRKEFEEVKGLAKEMKESGQTKILSPTPIVVVMPEVIVAQVSAQTPTVPYTAVS